MSTLERSRSAPSSDAARAHLKATLLAVAGEDRDAFKELYRLTNAKLFGICLRICGNHANAEDVLHEVYLLIWRRAGAWEPGQASPISWLAIIARNRSIDWLRAQASRPLAALDEVPDILDWQPDAEAILIAKGESIRLVECLNKLDPRQRYAIATAFFGGATYAEVAARAGVPTSTAKSWIRRGLQQLQNGFGVEDATALRR